MQNMAAQPIGIFDSGIGGLTVANAIVQQLPHERIIYFGDTAHLPYGDKSAAAIAQFSVQIVRFLLSQNCKCIVIACNTATTAALERLQTEFGAQLPIIDVVTPLVERVVAQNYKKVGVIATKLTIASGMYERCLRQLQPALQVASLPTPLLVPMIEEGFFQNKISQTIIDEYLHQPTLAGIDALLLACTHYPLIRKEIELYYKGAIKVYDSNAAVAAKVAQVLGERNLLSTQKIGADEFYVSDYTAAFEHTTRLFWQGEAINLQQIAV
jgi:glutamate racemase